ncbi:PREDICTED: lachrymatory-factor synthase-like [Prunus mume]|uniref:Lachrymatory-factor synthase-like n=1 Tax=Prunus mume TaxID=102107 RepID=A0ABM0N648_PRUMU|nr:PREDICTED: lachrymatory-factor synthase-like [Prunus mume]XP_008220098.1 PREDICTED: lachrymatory-factor synthase-like [Prunus mume]
MAEDQIPKSKWEGKASADLQGSSAEQVWPLLADFCSLHKWFPDIATCYQVDGVPGQPGLIRYCARAPIDNDESTIKWAKEKLLSLDPIQRCLSYEIIESNLGFKSYVAVMQLVPINGGDGSIGCKIEWSFVCDPIEGWGLNDFRSYLDSSLQLMAEKMMEHTLLPTTG